ADVAEQPGLIAIADRLAVGDLAQGVPRGELEVGALRVEFEVELRALAGEVLIELGDGRDEERGVVVDSLVERSEPAGDVAAEQERGEALRGREDGRGTGGARKEGGDEHGGPSHEREPHR